MPKIISIGRITDEKDLKQMYGLDQVTFEKGERVTLSFPVATDTDYYVTVAGVQVTCDGIKPGGKVFYSFTMPDRDVEVNIKSNSTMRMIENHHPGFFGFSNEKETKETDDEKNEKDTNMWEGKPEFCPACHASTKNAKFFCTECGFPLKTKSE